MITLSPAGAALVERMSRTACDSNSLPTGTQIDANVEIAKACLKRMKSCSGGGAAKSWRKTVADLVDLVDVNRNPKSYRQCQDVLAQTDIIEVLVQHLETDLSDSHQLVWEVLAALSFNHAELQKSIASKDAFCKRLQCLLGDRKSHAPCVLLQFVAVRALLSVSQSFDTHKRLIPLLPQIADLATGMQHNVACLQKMAIEVLVHLSSNPELCPKIAGALSSQDLKKLVARVRASGKQEDEFAIAIMLANLGTHPTQDGRWVLGSALDWVPFKDLNIFESLVSSLDAASKEQDWPPGSNIFHSAHRVTSLMEALACTPMIQAAYSQELSRFVKPLMGVVSSRAAGTEAACNALAALAKVPCNFGVMSSDASFHDDLQMLSESGELAAAATLLDYLRKYKDIIVVSGGGILWRSTELVARMAGKAQDVEWRLSEVKPEVVRSHVLLEVKDLAEEIDTSHHNGSELLGVLPNLPAATVTGAIAPWADIGLRDAEDAERRLVGLVEYCTGAGCVGAGTLSHAPEKTAKKLRMVSQLLHDQPPEAKLPLLITLAAHGGMCNVQKEVGIDVAYAQLTRTAAAQAEKTSFQACVFRLLRDKREQIMETLSVQYCRHRFGYTNTHQLVPFRNQLAEAVGLHKIPDSHQHEPPMTEDDVTEQSIQFWELYSTDVIISELDSALNGQPRRIPYDVFMVWIEQNAPANADMYSFFTACFDLKGHVRPAVIQHALCRLGVLRSSNAIFELEPHALIVQQGAAEWRGLEAFVALAKLWDLSADAEQCAQIVSDLYEARHLLSENLSDDAAAKELCQLLASAEGHLVSARQKPSAHECLVAGAFSLDELSSTVSVQLEKDCPRLATLLRTASRDLPSK